MEEKFRCPLTKEACWREFCMWYIPKDVRRRDQPGECAIKKIAEHLHKL